VVGDGFDVEEESGGDVLSEVASVGVEWRGDAGGCEGGIEEDEVGGVEALG
jgi:hypothetical protein